MNFRRAVPYGLWMVLLILGSLTDANAGTACTLQESCSSSNTCDAGDCRILFTRNGASVTVQVMINGTWQTITNSSWFCVPPGTSVSWTTASADFFARFAPSGNPSPFTSGQNTMVGTPTNGVSQTTISPVKPDCHSFAVAACDVSGNATGLSCGTADPRVVVGGGGNAHKGRAREGDKDND